MIQLIAGKLGIGKRQQFLSCTEICQHKSLLEVQIFF